MSIPPSPDQVASIAQCVAYCHQAGAADLETAALARDRIERLESVHGDSAIELIDLATGDQNTEHESSSPENQSGQNQSGENQSGEGRPGDNLSGPHLPGPNRPRPAADADSVRTAAAMALGKVRCVIDDSQFERLQAGLRNDSSGDVREALFQTLVNLADAMIPSRQSLLALMMSEIAAGGHGDRVDRSPREIRLATIAASRIRAITSSGHSSRTREAG